MILSLEITSESLGGNGRHTVDEGGARLGRHSGNSWVLPHPKVSANHAVITCRNGVFYIEDQKTTNGTYISAASGGDSWRRMEPGRAYPLASGDTLLVGPYEISVSVSGDQHRQAPRRDPFEADDPFFGPPVESPASAYREASDDRQDRDSIGFLPGEPPPPAQKRQRQIPAASDLERVSVLGENFHPPSALPDPAMPLRVEISSGIEAIPEGYDPLADASRGWAPQPSPPVRPRGPASNPPASLSIPADYDPLAPDQSSPSLPLLPRVPSREPEAIAAENDATNIPALAPVVVHPPRQQSIEEGPSTNQPDRGSIGSGDSPDFAMILAAAGLDPSQVSPEVARDFGRILRVVVAGVMDILRSRQEIKDEFRMRTTRFKPAENNNPLKFSADVNDALHNLLVKRNPAYLPAVDAFEDAFIDVRSHQVAMLAGIRVAFESLLAEFEPNHMQEEFDRQLNKGLVPVKHRYWDLYREKVEKILKDSETTYRRLFGEAFVRAYEDQVRLVKEQERAAKSGSKTPLKS